MDPYLEAPDTWPDFHDRMASSISSLLNAQLPSRYYARLQKRAELGIVLSTGTAKKIIPDISVLRRPLRETPAVYTAASTVVIDHPRTHATAAIDFRIPSDPFLHRFVEIRDSQRGHKLVTLIEIVSPSNKQPGPDRRAYESKQMEILSSDANLIEIDLLRGGRRLLPYPELAAAVDDLAPDYLVVLNRSALREGYWMDFTLYPTAIREPLPCIPVPLAGEDPDVLLDLQVAFNRAYVEGPYARMVDYTVDPDPPLGANDAIWANKLLVAASLRSPREDDAS
jgi:hypothetical protein